MGAFPKAGFNPSLFWDALGEPLSPSLWLCPLYHQSLSQGFPKGPSRFSQAVVLSTVKNKAARKMLLVIAGLPTLLLPCCSETLGSFPACRIGR